MRTEKEVLAQFSEWAGGNDLVRAAILTSSRANPARKTDFLSDYDIELYVTDLAAFMEDDSWMAPFGTIMVRWPFKPRSTFDESWITRCVIFEDGVRIDFQITASQAIASDAYDDDYKILIDKNGLTSNLGPPILSRNFVKKPTEEEYDTLVNEFWWDAHYVPKYLWRDELPFAASVMGQSIRDHFLRTIIEWYIGLQYDWSVNTGVHGRRFKRYLDGKIWSEYESTFAGSSIEENWDAFFNAVALFRKLTTIVGKRLGYEYPLQIDREMTEYYSSIHFTKNHIG